MNDRELIADAIAASLHDCDAYCPTHREAAFQAADAVLSELGDRLLPALPAGIVVNEIDHIALPRGYATYLVELCTDAGDGGFDWIMGYGPTISSAIRNALQSAQDGRDGHESATMGQET